MRIRTIFLFRLLCVAALFMLSAALPSPTAAAAVPAVAIAFEGREDTETVQLIKIKGTWTLMLPAGCHPDQLRSTPTVTLPDLSGAAQSSEMAVSAAINGKTASLRILPSENTGTIFVHLTRMKLSQFGDNKKRSDTGVFHLYDEHARPDSSGELTRFSLHGNSTLKAKKKSFNLKLAQKQSLLGMDRDRSWALISNAYDNSFARNYTALALAELLNMPFVPQQKPVDLYLNGQYLGVYMLCEKVQVGKGRVEIRDLGGATEAVNDEPLETCQQLGSKQPVKGKGKYYRIPEDPEDITGGYLLELELEARYNQLDSAYVTERGQIISIKAPKYVSEAQYNYISGLIQAMENAMYSPDGVDPVSGRRFEEIVDLDSACLKYMFEELLCNFDANKTSQFIYKDSDSVDTRLHFGPPWDYDISLANRSGEDGIEFIDPEALAVGVQVRMKLPVYYNQLYKVPQVRERIPSLFSEAGIRRAVEALAGVSGDQSGMIHDWTERTAKAVEKNYMVNPNRFFAYYTRAFGNDFRQHSASVSDFLYRRMLYLEGLWSSAP